jgi:hypothetical protein
MTEPGTPTRAVNGDVAGQEGDGRMSDSGAPYDKAIEETAKATSNAADLIREGGRAIGPAIGDIYGLMIGDKVRAARVRNLDRINQKRQQKLNDRGVTEPLQPPEDIAIPALEAAQGETRDEMQELWARLLANAMDPNRSSNVRPEFIETLRALQPIDAEILVLLESKPTGEEWVGPSQVERRISAVKVSFDRLVSLRCATGSDSAIKITDYGTELMFGLEQ